MIIFVITSVLNIKITKEMMLNKAHSYMLHVNTLSMSSSHMLFQF